MSAQTSVCPVCGKNDTIYKVSGVVASGQASGTFSGPSGGVVNVDGKWGTTYCSRDDVVFDPDTGRTCQPQNLKQFLYA